MRIFLDANIVFSAAQEGSPSRQLIDVLACHALLTSHPGVWEEAERNLRTKRPQWSEGLALLSAKVTLSSATGPCPDVGLPTKDQPVLASAIAARCERLLTGDRTHFGHLYGKTIAGVRILSPSLMVDEIRSLGWIS